MDEEIPIRMTIRGEAEIAKMQPGDILLVRLEHPATGDVRERVAELLRRDLPASVGVLVVDRTISLSILRPAAKDAVESGA